MIPLNGTTGTLSLIKYKYHQILKTDKQNLRLINGRLMTISSHFFANYIKIFHKTDALSFYGSKMILDRPNYFGWVRIVLDGSNSFWSCSNHFGKVQIIKISPEKSNMNLNKMIWSWPKQTWPKQFASVQNNLDGPKSFWTFRRTRQKS